MLCLFCEGEQLGRLCFRRFLKREVDVKLFILKHAKKKSYKESKKRKNNEDAVHKEQFGTNLLFLDIKICSVTSKQVSSVDIILNYVSDSTVSKF